jgi:hypothetical protein
MCERYQQMVDSQATTMAQAVIDEEEGTTGHIEILIEMAEIYPASFDEVNSHG